MILAPEDMYATFEQKQKIESSPLRWKQFEIDDSHGEEVEDRSLNPDNPLPR